MSSKHCEVAPPTYGCRNGVNVNILKFYSYSTFIHSDSPFIYLYSPFVYSDSTFVHSYSASVYSHSTFVCIQYKYLFKFNIYAH